MKKAIGVFLILALCDVPVFAATYQWVDERGTMNFTEDPGTIPPKYRKNATIVGAEELPAEQPPTEAKTPKTEQKSEESQPTNRDDTKKQTYGGKEGNQWRLEFARLRDALTRVDDQLNVKKTLYADPSKLTRLEYRSLEYEIKNLEAERAALQGKLDSLNSAADKAEVPSELRE